MIGRFEPFLFDPALGGNHSVGELWILLVPAGKEGGTDCLHCDLVENLDNVHSL